MTKVNHQISISLQKESPNRSTKKTIVSKNVAKQEKMMSKLHQTRKRLLRENPNAYIDYTS